LKQQLAAFAQDESEEEDGGAGPTTATPAELQELKVRCKCVYNCYVMYVM
jgi:hypothetical protein